MAAVQAQTLSIHQRRARWRLMIRNTVIWILLVAGALVMIFPIYWMVVTAFSPLSEAISRNVSLIPRVLTTTNFERAWTSLPWERWYFNSFLVTITSTALTVILNLLAGYTFAKFIFRGRNIFFFLIISTLMVPIQVILVPRFIITANLGLANTYWGVIIPWAAEAFGVFFVRQFMITFPDELLEAARLDGAGELHIFYRIVLPLSKPAIAVLTIMAFSWRWNAFIWPLVVLTRQELYTVQLGLNYMKGFYYTEWSQIMAMALLSLIPIVIVFVLFQRYFIEGIAHTGIK